MDDAACCDAVSDVVPGKEPSLKLAKLAPKSNVAQHMASHIFIRFGDWSEVVEVNQVRVCKKNTQRSVLPGCDVGV